LLTQSLHQALPLRRLPQDGRGDPAFAIPPIADPRPLHLHAPKGRDKREWPLPTLLQLRINYLPLRHDLAIHFFKRSSIKTPFERLAYAIDLTSQVMGRLGLIDFDSPVKITTNDVLAAVHLDFQIPHDIIQHGTHGILLERPNWFKILAPEFIMRAFF